MTTEEEVRNLRRHLQKLADGRDEALYRYQLRWPPMPPGTYWRLRWLVGWTLRLLESMGVKKPDGWPVTLKHAAGGPGITARPLLVWAVGVDRNALREACPLLVDLQRAAPDFSPVLITDVADFTAFSRLHYLVEYLPSLKGEGAAYEDRKARLLARLYRGAPVLTVRAILENSGEPQTLRRLIAAQGG